jgi:phage terminase large subunit
MTKVIVGFNKGFKQINSTRKRYRLFKGSAGSGKSVNIAQDFILKLMGPKNKGANLLVVRKIDASNKDSTFAELTAAIERVCGAKWQSYWKVKQSPLELECLITDNKIIFRGMKDVNEREKENLLTSLEQGYMRTINTLVNITLILC